MTFSRRQVLSMIASVAPLLAVRSFINSEAFAQEGLGPFMPHEGGVLTTAWTNGYGPDAESWIRFSKILPDTFDINYSSSRGTKVVRRIRVTDRAAARTLILGYNKQMPLVIDNTTTLGTSTAVLDDLRKAGTARLDLIADTSLQPMPGEISLVTQKKMEIMVAGSLASIPVIEVNGRFGTKRKTAQGTLYFLDNRNNPLLLEYSLQFSGEKVPRTERIVIVTPGAGEHSAMEQALATVRSYTTRGIHFEFDKATIQPDSRKLLKEISTTLRNNPIWTLQITGHTDSIGKESYNLKLSEKRATAIKSALIDFGVPTDRLTAQGVGSSQPVETNKTLEGRAQNRRVVLTRTDR